MSIVKMKKLAVIGLDTAKEKLISDLMELGAVEITDQNAKAANDELWKNLGVKDGDADKLTTMEYDINRVAVAIDTLEKYSVAKKPLFETRKAIKQSEFAKTMEGRDKIKEDIAYVLDLNDELHALRETINKKQSELLSITPWTVYEIPLEVEETKYTMIHLGVVPTTTDMDALYKRVSEATDPVVFREINRDRDLIYLATITLNDIDEDILTILKQHGYTPLPFRDFKGTAAENKVRLEKEIAEAEKEVARVEAKITEADKLKFGIQCVYDQMSMEKDKEKVKSKLLKTKRAFNLEGWVPEKACKAVSKLLDENGCHYDFRDPADDEEVPVLTENSSGIFPFEIITEMYSLPDYRGVDPTKFFAIFYAMFFGIMLSDAGYGIVIAIACFVVLRKYDLEGATYKMIKMFFYCGLSTVFWGALFGGWFGDFFQVAAKTMFGKEITISPIWFNPIDDPTRLLIWSLIFGVVHLFLGMGIKAGMLIKDGKMVDAICDIFSWYLVILGAAMYLAGGSILPILPKIGMVMAIVGALILLFTGGRKNKGFGKVTGGLSSLYNVTSYISDILSYSRLLALGLATGVIAQVVNTMGSLMGGGVIGSIVLLIVFVIGHTFNLAINALGAFVHSSRLQYIEFFGKFYEDGGEEFKPFNKNTKYVRITKDSDGGKK